MPGRPPLFDLPCRSATICRSCRLAIRQQHPTQQIWAAAYSTKTRTRARRPVDDAISRKPSKAEMLQYLQRIRSLRSPTQEKKKEDGFSVKYFEQDESRRTQQTTADEFDGELDMSALRNAMLGVKDQMGGQEDKGVFDEVVGQLGGDLERMRTPDDLQRLVEKIRAYGAAIDAEIDEAGTELPREMLEELELELPGLPGAGNLGSRVTLPQVPEKPWTVNQRKKVARLNQVLARVSRDVRRDVKLTNKSVQAVYKAYHAARLSLAHGWNNVPPDVWDFLWTVFSADEKINIHRLAHLSLLSRDMSEAKIVLSPAQQLVTIEAVFVDGWEAKAMDNWKRCMSTLGDEDAETFQEFWELGVRVFCRAGDLEQAQRAVNKLLEKQTDPRILMPLIRTWAELGTEDGQEQSWVVYRQLRELLGDDMKIEDYDQVISYFLATNQTENALFAFVDMMSLGRIDLKKKKHLPSVIANKFFIGKWLKRLIGAGDLNGAMSVVDYMRKKGVGAAPIHLNGLIGALHRSGGVDDLEKADEMAWGMIASRVAFVEQRRDKTTDRPKMDTQPSMLPLPHATLETFSILAENYRLRGLHDRLQTLWQASRDAEISLDAFMVNQLLESHIQAGESKQALELYRGFVTERGVKPDPYTFSALWKTLAINRLHRVGDDELPAAARATRRMFAETVRFRDVFGQDGMDGQLARKILHTFRRVRDPAGLVVAMTALRDLFRFLPTEVLVLEMLLGSTKLTWETPSLRRRLVNAKRKLDASLVEAVGGDPAKLEGGARDVALFEHLRGQFWPQEVDERTKSQAFRKAATEMGVYDLLKGSGQE